MQTVSSSLDSQNYTFIQKGTSPPRSFRVVFLGRGPVVELKTAFSSPVETARVNLDSSTEQTLLRAFPGYSFLWRLHPGDLTIRPPFHIGSEVSSARNDFDEITGKLEKMKADEEGALDVVLSPSDPKTFRAYLKTMSPALQRSWAYGQYVALLLTNNPPELCSVLKGSGLVSTKREALRKAQTELSSRLPATISLLRQDQILETYALFEDLHYSNSDFQNELRRAGMRHASFEQFLQNPGLTLVAINGKTELELIRVLPIQRSSL